MGYFILLDIGGTDIKTAIYKKDNLNFDKLLKSRTTKFLPSQQGKFEISPTLLMRDISDIFKTTYHDNKKDVCGGIFMAGQMGGWVGTDQKNNPVTNLISWQDRHSDNIFDKKTSFFDLFKQSIDLNWFENTGREIRSGLPIVSYAARRGNTNQKIDRMHTLLSWTASQLSEDYSFISHETDFASTGLFNLTTRSVDLFTFEDIFSSLEFPYVTNKINITGYSTMFNCPIYVAVGDHQASILGSGFSDNSVVVNIGTGGQISTHIDRGTATNFQIRPYFFNSLLETKTHLPAGRIISKVVDSLNKYFEQTISIYDFYYLPRHTKSHYRLELKDIDSLDKQINYFVSVGLTAEDIALIFLNSMASDYIAVLNELNKKDFNKIIFAGGVGQHFMRLQNAIKYGLKTEIVVAQTEETTINGLRKIADLVLSNNI